jgi:hypothetical protein
MEVISRNAGDKLFLPNSINGTIDIAAKYKRWNTSNYLI